MGFLKDIVTDAKLRPSRHQGSDDGDGLTYHQIHSPAEFSNQHESTPGSVLPTDFTNFHDENEISVSTNEIASVAKNNEAVQPSFSFAQHPVQQHIEHTTNHQTNKLKGKDDNLTFSGANEDYSSIVAEPVISGEINIPSQLDEANKTTLNPAVNKAIDVAQSPVIESPMVPVANDVNDLDVNDPDVNDLTALQSIEKMNSESNDVPVRNTQMQIEANHSARQTLNNNLVGEDKSDPITSHVELLEPREMDAIGTPSVADVLHDTGLSHDVDLNHGVNLNRQQPYSDAQQQSTFHPARDLKSNSMSSTEQDGVDINKYNSTRQVKRLNPQAAVSLTDVESGTLDADELPQSSSQTDVANNRATVLTASHDKNLINSLLQADNNEEANRRSNLSRSHIAPEEEKLLSKKINANDDSDPALSRTPTEDALILSSRLSRPSTSGKGASNAPSIFDAEATDTIIQGSNASTVKDNSKLSNHISKETADRLQTYSGIQTHKNKIGTDEVIAAPQEKSPAYRINSPPSVAGTFRKHDDISDKVNPSLARTDDVPTLSSRIYRSPLADVETTHKKIGTAKSAAQVMRTEQSNKISNTPRTYLDSVLQGKSSAAIEPGLPGLNKAKQIKPHATPAVEKSVSFSQQASVLPSSKVSNEPHGIKQAQQFLVGHGLRIPSLDKAPAGPTVAKPAPPQVEPPKLEIGQIDIVVEEAEVKDTPSRSVNTEPQDFASRHYLRGL